MAKKVTMTSSDCGKLLWVVSLVVPLGGCSDLSSGAAFVAVFCAIVIAMVLWGFIDQCVRKSFRRPVWLDVPWWVAVVTIFSTTLAKALGLGDERLMNSIGWISIVIFGLCIVAEGVVEFFGGKTELAEITAHGKRWLVSVVLFGLFVAAIGSVELVRSW